VAAREKTVLLLDFETNGDAEDASSAPSHAAVVARYVRREILEHET
jgi:hypothetical protein